jgi:hypothetical protein
LGSAIHDAFNSGWLLLVFTRQSRPGEKHRQKV